MPTDLTDLLCTRCGLCCDGTLFADVELAGRAEAARLEALGLEIEEGDAAGEELLVQPCAALRGTRCTIYAQRPGCCRTFECRLLQDARRGAVSVDQALAHIAQALALVLRGRALLRQLGAGDARRPLGERAAEALADAADVRPAAAARRAELATTMAALERRVRTTFLGPR